MLRIHDPDEKLDTNKIRLGNRVWIQAGRDEDHLFNLFSGVCRTFKPVRAGYNLLTYEMSGFGTQIIFNERIVNFIRQSLRRPDNPNRPFFDDPNMKAYLLFKELCEKTDIIPTVYPAIKHTLYAGMFNTTELIDPAVDTFIASLTEPYVQASQVANSIADMAGAIWGVEPGSPSTPDKVFLRFPSTTHSGIVIKDRPDSQAIADEPISRNMSYLLARTGFTYTDSIKQEDGFTNKPFSKTGQDLVSSSAASEDLSTPMQSIDIAQQITVNSTQFRDIAMTFHVEGKDQELEDSGFFYLAEDVEFAIVNDDAGKPGSQVEVSGKVPLRQLNNNEVKQVFLQLPQQHGFKFLKPGDKAWFICYAEGIVRWTPELQANDGCGLPVDGYAGYWHHDGGTTGTSALRTICKHHQGVQGKHVRSIPISDTTSGWVINNAGPTYSYTFFDSFSHIVEAAEADSIETYGESDAFIDANWITDEDTMSSYLASFGQYAAKPRRIYEMAETYIPYLSPLIPGQLVTVIDSKSGLSANKNTVAEIQSVRYEFSAESAGRSPLGTNTCEIKLLGYVDYKEQYILAYQQEVLELPIEPPGTGQPPPTQPPPTEPPPTTGNLIDTDKILVLNRLDTTQGKFHHNLVKLNPSGNLDSSTNLAVDADGDGTRTTLGSLAYYAFDAREGSFASGGSNRTLRLDWKSTTGSTTCGVSKAKTAGTIGRANDTKNAEITCIFRARNFISGSSSHFHASIKPRGDSHSDSNECTLQAGGRHPYQQGGRHADLYSVEYTHPSYDYHNVTFVSPYNSNSFPLIQTNAWFGMKFIIYNVNNNQTVHAEMWIDDNPIKSDNSGFNNNWKKIWVFEHSGSKSPTWAGPNCQFRTNMASQVDVIAYNIHEIIPPTTTSSTANAIELAERAEFEESTGMRHPEWIAQIKPLHTDEQLFAATAIPPSLEIPQDSVNAAGESIPADDMTVTGGDTIPVKKILESEPLAEAVDEGDD